MSTLLLLLLFFKTHSCASINQFFEDINENVKTFNAIGADIAWQSSVEPKKLGLADRSAKYQQDKIAWQHETCRTLSPMHDQLLLNATQERQAYLLCREPKYHFKEARALSNIYEELQSIYSNIETCVPNSEKDTTNLTEIESAILNYMSNNKEISKMEQSDPSFDITVNADDGVKKGLLCLKGEEDFEKMMEFSRNPKVLEWVWSGFREKVKGMREPYKKLVDLENKAARRNGYRDIGHSWRDELEIPDLRGRCRQLYRSVRPLYTLLHGVVRYFLRRQYGDAVDKRGPIPAHLLGDLWSQNWESLAGMILPGNIKLDDRIKQLGWTVHDMVKRAEDFYMSLGLPAMSDTFWRESVFTREDHKMARCHGTAADMFKDGDFRLLYCSGVTFKDFYVLHHEMGHIQYYMAYEKQPALFRQANSAFHESIGDTIMYGVMTPQHLHRLRLINDSELYSSTSNTNTELVNPITKLKHINSKVNSKELMYYDDYKSKLLNNNQFKIATENKENNEQFKGESKYDKEDDFKNAIEILDDEEPNDEIFNRNLNLEPIRKDDGVDKILHSMTTDEMLLFKQALSKLPQIPFSLLMDEYRWRYFEGSLHQEHLNREFWAMARELQGISPPNDRGEDYFDVGAKFHVPDNTPYIRYFLSSFLQHQIFESLCKAAVFGRRNVEEPLPDTIALNRCDIYGSKSAGKILKDIMSRGASQNWQQILQETTGKIEIDAAPLKRYYRPLYRLLKRLVLQYDIPIGW